MVKVCDLRGYRETGDTFNRARRLRLRIRFILPDPRILVLAVFYARRYLKFIMRVGDVETALQNKTKSVRREHQLSRKLRTIIASATKPFVLSSADRSPRSFEETANRGYF